MPSSKKGAKFGAPKPPGTRETEGFCTFFKYFTPKSKNTSEFETRSFKTGLGAQKCSWNRHSGPIWGPAGCLAPIGRPQPGCATLAGQTGIGGSFAIWRETTGGFGKTRVENGLGAQKRTLKHRQGSKRAQKRPAGTERGQTESGPRSFGTAKPEVKEGCRLGV